MKPLLEIRPRRIALIKPSALGDVVHSLPVLAALRRRWPDAHITWIINRAYEPLIAGHPDLNATLPFDRATLRRGPVAAARTMFHFLAALRHGQFDTVIDLQGLLRTGLMARTSGAAVRIGFANAREGAPRFYTHRIDVPDAERIHAVDRYWRVVEAIGAGDGPIQFHVPIRAEARHETDRILASLPRPYLMVAVGARWLTKRWPVRDFAAAAQHVLRRAGGTVILVGGSEDRDLSDVVVHRLGDRARNLCGRTSLPVLAALLDRADVMLSNDTGPLHLAAALGRPCVAPYTCTLVRKHGPYGQLHRTASATVSCAGSYLRTCPDMICMPTLPVERITPLLDEVLHRWAQQQPA